MVVRKCTAIAEALGVAMDQWLETFARLEAASLALEATTVGDSVNLHDEQIQQLQRTHSRLRHERLALMLTVERLCAAYDRAEIEEEYPDR